jgi:hypothetical protein
VSLPSADYFQLVAAHVEFLLSHLYKQPTALSAVYVRKGMSDTEAKDSKIKVT